MANLSGIKVMVAGHICLDIAPMFPASCSGHLNDILIPGKLINVNQAVLCTGGAVSNTGLTMAKLGLDVLLNGKVGNDQFGRIIKDLVGQQRASSFNTVDGQDTSYSVIIALPNVDRIFLHNPGTNDTFGPEDVDYDAMSDCKLFHFGYPPLMKRLYQNQGRELIDIFKKAKTAGVTTSLDMTLPDPASESGQVDWYKILQDLLPFVDIYMPSIEETAFMLDPQMFYDRKCKSAGSDAVHAYNYADYDSLSGKLLELGTKIVALKSGIRGYYLRTSNVEKIGKAAPLDFKSWSYRQLWAQSFTAEQFGSATGAGDATIAGFLSALLAGFGPEQSLRIANIVGWQNVRAIDALSGIEDWDATIRYAADKNKKQNPAGLQDIWKYSQTDAVFFGPRDKIS